MFRRRFLGVALGIMFLCGMARQSPQNPLVDQNASRQGRAGRRMPVRVGNDAGSRRSLDGLLNRLRITKSLYPGLRLAGLPE